MSSSLKSPKTPPVKIEPDRLKPLDFTKEPAKVKLGALAIERSPDILTGLGKACWGLAVLLAVLLGVSFVPSLGRFLPW